MIKFDILDLSPNCQYGECSEKSTKIVSGDTYGIMCFCNKHANEVCKRGPPEITTRCPACGHEFPITDSEDFDS